MLFRSIGSLRCSTPLFIISEPEDGSLLPLYEPVVFLHHSHKFVGIVDHILRVFQESVLVSVRFPWQGMYSLLEVSKGHIELDQNLMSVSARWDCSYDCVEGDLVIPSVGKFHILYAWIRWSIKLLLSAGFMISPLQALDQDRRRRMIRRTGDIQDLWMKLQFRWKD